MFFLHVSINFQTDLHVNQELFGYHSRQQLVLLRHYTKVGNINQIHILYCYYYILKNLVMVYEDLVI